MLATTDHERVSSAEKDKREHACNIQTNLHALDEVGREIETFVRGLDRFGAGGNEELHFVR